MSYVSCLMKIGGGPEKGQDFLALRGLMLKTAARQLVLLGQVFLALWGFILKLPQGRWCSWVGWRGR